MTDYPDVYATREKSDMVPCTYCATHLMMFCPRCKNTGYVPSFETPGATPEEIQRMRDRPFVAPTDIATLARQAIDDPDLWRPVFEDYLLEMGQIETPIAAIPVARLGSIELAAKASDARALRKYKSGVTRLAHHHAQTGLAISLHTEPYLEINQKVEAWDRDELDYPGYRRQIVPRDAEHWKIEDAFVFNEKVIRWSKYSGQPQTVRVFAVSLNGEPLIRSLLGASLALSEGMSMAFTRGCLSIEGSLLVCDDVKKLGALFASLVDLRV